MLHQQVVCFSYLDLDWQKYVQIDPQYLRLSEVNHLVGDSSKAARDLGWRPRVSFEELIRLMVDADLADLKLGHTAPVMKQRV